MVSFDARADKATSTLIPDVRRLLLNLSQILRLFRRSNDGMNDHSNAMNNREPSGGHALYFSPDWSSPAGDFGVVGFRCITKLAKLSLEEALLVST